MKSGFGVVAGFSVAILAATVALAQKPAPPSPYVNNQLNQFRNSSIGNDYTISQVNNLTLRRSAGQVFNVNGTNITQASSPVSSLGGGDITPPTRMAAGFNSFGSMGTSSKPFTNTTRDPTVSPYMNLFRDGFDDEFDNYNTLVRPILQQQQINRSLELQTQSIDRRIQAMAAKPAFNPEGSTTQYPTGHPTGFMYHSHFYPGMQAQRRR